MKIGDIYKSKQGNSFISIDSFATRFGQDYDKENNPLYIVIKHLQIIDDSVGTCPSDNEYGTQEEIEEYYELYLPQEKLIPMNYMEEMNKMKELMKIDYETFATTLNKLIEDDKELQNELSNIWKE